MRFAMTMPRWLWRLLDVLYVAVLTLLLVRPPRGGDPADLDDGWQGLLQFDWLEHARSGVDSVFTYGPTGFLLAQSMLLHDGLLARALLGLLLALALALGLWWLRMLLPGARWRAVYLATVMGLAPFLEGSMVFQAMAALGVACVWTVGATPPSPSRVGRAALLALTMA